MDHQMTRESNGVGNMATITPKCSCGWAGHGVAAYNDDQYFQIHRQEEYHRLKVQPEVTTRAADAAA